jgi:hypothetical protein
MGKVSDPPAALPATLVLALPTLFSSTVVQQSSCQLPSVPQELIFTQQFRGLGSRGRGCRADCGALPQCSVDAARPRQGRDAFGGRISASSCTEISQPD